MQAVDAEGLSNDDFDVMVDGVGRMVSTDKIAGAISYFGACISLSNNYENQSGDCALKSKSIKKIKPKMKKYIFILIGVLQIGCSSIHKVKVLDIRCPEGIDLCVFIIIYVR